MSTWRFQGSKMHLTYKTHLSAFDCKLLMQSFGDVKVWSFVHEIGSEDEDTPTPYEHTHVFVWWRKRLDITDVRAFDMGTEEDPIHPNMKFCKSIKWAKHVTMKYHLGHKTTKDGKKYFKEPVMLIQDGVDEWKFEADMWTAVQNAPTLQEACEFMGAQGKSIADCKAIRNECRKRKYDSVRKSCVKPWIPCEIDWNKEDYSLVIIGDSMAGKTNWAKAQFERPFVITQLEDLKDIPPGCDGLVWDDMDCQKYSIQNQKMITDCREATSIWSRNKNSRKPQLPQIFTANKLPFDIVSDDGAVGNRIQIWRKKGKMYIE